MPALKQKNQPLLIAALVLNCAYIYIFILNNPLHIQDVYSVLNIKNMFISSGIFIISITINSIISGPNKLILIFWKKDYYYPGCFAFSKYLKQDKRINEACLEEKYGKLPTDNEEQNKVWYKMYKNVANKDSVSLAQKYFLFFRDYCFMMIILTIALIFYFIL